MTGLLDAVKSCAWDLGLDVEDPVVLQATNNTVMRLDPLPLVAKVATGHLHGRLEDELEVARYLSARAAPVIALAPSVPPRVHRARGFEMTFWHYGAQDDATDPASASVAAALAELHDGLDGYEPGGRRRFDDELGDLRRRLDENPDFAPALTAGDRVLLREALDHGLARLQVARRSPRLLHGSPHRYNILAVGGSPRFIDFETVCWGPLEWDLAHLEADVASCYPAAVDEGDLQECRLLVSAKTAAWCWHSIDSSAGMRFHAEHHLRLVREAKE